MSNTDSLQGALTTADLQAIWEGSVDRSYREPLLTAGEGGGFEVYTQAFEQLAAVSRAIDESTQQLYIQPWSGQSNEPAVGASNATVALQLTRSGYMGRPLILRAGLIVVDEVQLDHGPDGPVPTNTGRQYILQEDAVFFPGEQGPLTVQARAAKPGRGYNYPLPGSISSVENAGTKLRNDLATLTSNPGAVLPAPPSPAISYTLTGANVTDMPIPGNVGQYVLFTGGLNRGATALVQAFVPPDPDALVGSGVVLAPIVTWESYYANWTQNLVVGATVQFLNGSSVVVAVGTLLGWASVGSGFKFAVQLLQGSIATATTMYQDHAPPLSASSAPLDCVFTNGTLIPEAPSGSPLTGGSSWLVLDWADDWGLVCTNVAQPTGGALGMLDLLGAERNLPRQRDESDDLYRDRLWQIADVVTPNAIKRALYGALSSLPWCYRETGDGTLPGFFYDRTDEGGDFYDDDSLIWTLSGASPVSGWRSGDPLVYQRQVPVVTGPWIQLATGTFGSYSAPNLIFVRKSGEAFDPLAGDRIFNRRTGTWAIPLTSVPNDIATIRRWHVYLSLQDMRAYFVVEVPRVPFGEFGFAYDDSPLGAYDASPEPDFYDGYPAGSANTYGRAWAALDSKRAGGVGFDLRLSGGPCL